MECTFIERAFLKKRMDAFEAAMIPVINSKIFTDEEINKLTKKVEQHELKLAALKPCLDDFKAATKYEEGVYFELRRRKKQRALQNVDHLERIFVKRILSTYRKGLKHFSNDSNFNLACFDFMKRLPDSLHSTHQLATKMLQAFEYNPDVFRKISVWYFQCGKTEDALTILQRGQYLHPESMEIYLDLIEMELKLLSELNNYNDRRNQQLTHMQNRFKTYVDGIVKAGITYRFLQEIIQVIENLEFAKVVVDYAIEQILLAYRHEPGAWTFIALRELKGNYHPSCDELKKSTPYSIQRAVQRFKDGILMVSLDNKPLLWRNYLDMLVKVHKEEKSSQTLSFLRDGLEEAAKAEIAIGESHYVAWSECSLNNMVTLVKIMEEGTMKYPSSVLLWSMYLQYYICQDQRELAKHVFGKAVYALGPRSVKIWEAYFDYHKLGFPPKDIDNLYEKVISQPHQEIAKLFKPRYLDWIIGSKGIEAGRKLYLRIADQPPYAKKLHSSMFYSDKMNDIQILTTPFQEKVLDYWMEQFGAEDLDVHYQKFVHVRTIGGPDVNRQLLAVYAKAIRTLTDMKKISRFKELVQKIK